jgi:hypothetical protein
MASHANKNWNLPDAVDWGHVRVALLMDIRGELRAINSKLSCHRIQRMFGTIERIDKRLAKKIPMKEKK